MHLTYLGNLLLCVWSNPACFSEVYVRRLEIVQWAWCVWLYVCVCVGGGGQRKRVWRRGEKREEGKKEEREEIRGWGEEGEGEEKRKKKRVRNFLTSNSSMAFTDE